MNLTKTLVIATAGALAVWAQTISEKARKLHQDAFVFDAHVHMVNRQFYNGGNIGDRVPDGQVDLPRMKEGGVDALFFSLFIPEDYYPARYETKQALRLLDAAYRQIAKNSSEIGVALNADDIQRLNRQGKMAAVLDLEGSFDLDGDLGVLRMLYRLGLRSFQLSAHNWPTNFADSCCAPPKNNGLTEHGREVIREANRLGMVINVAHGSQRMIEEAVDASSQPIVSTHDGLKFFNDIPRTMAESTLRKLAARGGLIGIQIGNEFHNRKLYDYRVQHAGHPFWERGISEERLAKMSIFEIDRLVAPQYPMVGIEAPDSIKFSVDQWFQVVDKVIEWVGEDHVILGTDFDGGPTLPTPMRDVRDLPLLTQAMLKRGYSEERIRKFLGLNLLRVFRQVTEHQP
jgi:membrane dipeptidase